LPDAGVAEDHGEIMKISGPLPKNDTVTTILALVAVFSSFIAAFIGVIWALGKLFFWAGMWP
jgi:hypothetical protein